MSVTDGLGAMAWPGRHAAHDYSALMKQETGHRYTTSNAPSLTMTLGPS